MMDKQWKVLLVGGSSATGKSYLARQLAGYYQTTLTEVDDIRIALQQKLKPSDYPDLFFFLENKNFLNDFPIDILLSKLKSIGNEVWPSLNALIDKHIACNEAIIFEGDGVIPRLVADRDQKQVKSIFIYDSLENIKQRELARKRGGENPNLEKQVEFSYQYGQLIKEQAEANSFSTILTSPIDTLFSRTVLALGG